MTKEELIEVCEKIINDRRASEAIALLSEAARTEYVRECVANARHRSALKAARKILDANERIDKETRNSLLGLVEVEE